MEVSKDAMIKVEEYPGYQDCPHVRHSFNMVQWALDEGLINKARILQTFTNQIRLALPGDGNEYPDVLQNITQSFDALRDDTSTNTTIDQAKLHAFLLTTLKKPHQTAAAVDALLRIFTWHAAYPFQPSSSPAVDADAFTRAIALLTLAPPRIPAAPRLDVDAPQACHGVLGSFVTSRGRDAADLRRWLFRSLAREATTTTKNSAVVFVNVPRMVVDSGSSSSSTCFWYMHAEDERLTDLVDVVADTFPTERNVRPPPTRESCVRAVEEAGFLGRVGEREGKRGLGELVVRADVLDALLVQALGLEERRLMGMCAAELGWEEFDGWLKADGCTEAIAEGLDRIFGQFK